MNNRKWMSASLLIGILLAACSNQDGGKEASGDGSSSSGGKKTVTIAVMRSDRFLETAAAQFEALHPDIHMEIKPYMATPESAGNGMVAAISQVDIEKYVQTVTTQVISGKAADLIAMNGLPLNKFVDKKLLANLNERMAQDSAFDKSRYYENILKGSQNGGGLYAMPLSFYIDGMMSGKSSLLKQANITIDDRNWTWDEFRETAKKMRAAVGSDYTAFVNLFPNQLLSEYIEANYPQLVSGGKANFDSELFRGMMRQIKTLYDEGILKAEFSYDYSKTLFSAFGLYNVQNSLTDLLRPDTLFFTKPTVDGKPRGVMFRSTFTLGLNSKSQVQPEAWEFIKFLLSEEMQASPELSGYPIAKAAVESKLQLAKSAIEQGAADTGGLKPDSAAIDRTIEQLRAMLDAAAVNAISDNKVFSIAMTEFESYMSGQKSAEEVSALIQNRVTTYLNE
ncbi:ABC transporter substrate-binding protein [Paenibacillus ginsengarvi]|uniref:Extracellular solute-binding protein n=1 Tax=Paenibacillus ginsengarvi TaxID=400777 RepID=A0A3B0CH10_9BACL|nr:extracellular solute-binding protein [Paenibacillus ginsengarvi]RKN84430.1 extracellular solute-binding protein [Paenibacillus ginsengarvi]